MKIIEFLKTHYRWVSFVEDTHTYVDTSTGEIMTGATTFLQRYYKPFNQALYSRLEARKQGRTPNEIIRKWNADRDVALALGKVVHVYIERKLNNAPNRLAPFRPQMLGFSRWWDEHRNHLNLIGTEIVVGNKDWKIAGTPDALFSAKSGYSLWDWKTGKNFTLVSPYNNQLLPPFDDLSDCSLTRYSLQLSLYALMLRNAGIFVRHMNILHMANDGSTTVYKVIDLQDRLEKELEKAILAGS